MPGRVAALYRHPVKGFTPERLAAALLEAGAAFPVRPAVRGRERPLRLRSGRARLPVQAEVHRAGRHPGAGPGAHRATTRPAGVLTVDGRRPRAFCGRPGDADGRAGLRRLAGAASSTRGPERPAAGAGGPAAPTASSTTRPARSRCSTWPACATWRERLGVAIDPLRFRANVYVEGWPAWAELGLAPGARGAAGRGRGAGGQADRPLRRHPRRPGDRRARPRPGARPVRPLRPPAAAASTCRSPGAGRSAEGDRAGADLSCRADHAGRSVTRGRRRPQVATQ